MRDLHNYPKLWEETAGAGFTDKFAVLLLEAATHYHGKDDMGRPAGRPWVSYNDAVEIAHFLDKTRPKEK